MSNPTAVTASTSTAACSSHIYFGTSNPPTANQSTYSVTTAVTLYAYVHGCPGYQDSSIGNASYTIAAVTGATPVLGPFAATGQVGNGAWYPANPTLNFQYQNPGTSSWAVPISISNCSNSYNSECAGSGSLTVSSIVITGANANDFTLAGTTAGTLSTGQYLSPTVTFTPSASSGSAETATLTVNYSGATVSSQSMTLEGTSQTMTMLSSSACPTALASGTKYQLAANITCPNTVFTEGNNTNTVLNLAGHTITYCNTPSSSLAAAVLMAGNSQNLHVYGGHIVEPTGNLCTGTTGGSYPYSSGWVINSSDGSSSGSFGTQLSLLTGSLNDGAGKVLFEENGNTPTALSTSVTMVNYQDNSAYHCASVGCRAGDQDYPILVDGSTKAAPTLFEMIGGVGGTQGATVTSAANSIWEYNTLNPGSTVATTSNGFAIQDWATEATIAYNQIMTSPGVPCVSCRGIQIGSIVTPVTGSQIHDNYILVTQLANDAEYGGCQGGGGYGIQLNTAGSGLDLSNNIIEHNTVIATDKACNGPAFSFSNATNANGPNQSIDNHFECDLASSSSGVYPCQGIQFLANEYQPAPNGSFVSTGDTILGDTSAFDIAWDGTSSWTCTNCTFGPGKNPVSTGSLFLDYDNGGGSSTTSGGSQPFTIIGPTFTGGMTAAQNNLASLATNNPTGLSFYYLIQWPYKVTVEKSSTGAPISGATVTAIDANSAVECSTTTNGSGVASCTLNGAKYAVASGAHSTVSYNPFAISIAASGCTADNYSLTITSSTTATIQLGGC